MIIAARYHNCPVTAVSVRRSHPDRWRAEIRTGHSAGLPCGTMRVARPSGAMMSAL